MNAVLIADIPPNARLWRNCHETWRWCRQYTGIDISSHKRWLEKISVDPTIKMFGLRDEFSNRKVGVCGFTSINHLNQSAEFSLYIAPKERGMGYGKSGLLNLFAHGFLDFNFNRIWGESFEGNPALRVFDSIGMTREGCLRESYYRNGEHINSIVISLLRGEWKARYGEWIRE